MPTQLVASRNADGILLEWQAYALAYSSSYIFTPDVVFADKIQILHSQDDTLDFKIIFEGERTAQYLFETKDPGSDHYFRLKAISSKANPFISPPLHIQYRSNPTQERLIELPYDYNLQLGNFSKDGTEFLYSRLFDWRQDGRCCEEYSAMEFNLTSKLEELLLPKAFYALWSPEGDQITFHSSFIEDFNTDVSNIGLYIPASDSVIQLTSGENKFEIPVWHPDGQSIVFLSYNDSRYSLWDVYSLDLASLSYSPFSGNPEFKAFHERMSFSPDNSMLAFSRTNDNSYQNIYALNLEDQQISPIVESIWIDQHPSFSPDGKYLAFLSFRSGRDEIWIKDLSSEQLIQVTGDLNDYIFGEMSWSPDGQYLYFNVYRDETFGICYTEINL